MQHVVTAIHSFRPALVVLKIGDDDAQIFACVGPSLEDHGPQGDFFLQRSDSRAYSTALFSAFTTTWEPM
jgi:hypothetical protein